MEPVDREGNIKIVCYTTVHSTTHAVCCDIVDKKLLDSEYRNEEIFSYADIHKNTKKTMQIMESLGANIDEACILYIVCWKSKSKAKKKR